MLGKDLCPGVPGNENVPFMELADVWSDEEAQNVGLDFTPEVYGFFQKRKGGKRNVSSYTIYISTIHLSILPNPYKNIDKSPIVYSYLSASFLRATHVGEVSDRQPWTTGYCGLFLEGENFVRYGGTIDLWARTVYKLRQQVESRRFSRHVIPYLLPCYM